MLLFDQYDEESSSSYTRQYGHPSVRPKIICNYEDEEGKPPIFKRHKINFQPEDVITHLAVSNNQMILAMRNKKLLRIDLMNPDQPIEIELAQFLGDKAQMAKLYQVYLSPSGKHSLLSFASDLKNLTPFDNLYLSKKIHQASKLKGHLITALAWNFLNEKDNTTGNILIGTSKGLVFETELAPDETKWLMNSSLEKYFNQVFDAGPEAGPVTGIQFHRIPGNDTACFILVTTTSRLYQCVGKIGSSAYTDGPYLVNVFNNIGGQFQDIPNTMGFSKLDFSFDSSLNPEAFGWLTEPGILYGKLSYDPSSTIISKDGTLLSFTDESVHSNISTQLSTSPSTQSALVKEKPIGIILTKFHVLVLFRNLLRVICVLSEEIVLEDKFTEACGSVIGIAKDLVKGTIWVYFELAVYRYKITEEDRFIWKIYLAKKDFTNAKRFTNKDPIKMDEVICEEAQYYFDRKDYNKSAELYAQSGKSFDEIALKFMQLKNEEALKKFLNCKLNVLSPAKNQSQIDLITIWLVELIMSQIGRLKIKEYSLSKVETEDAITSNKLGSEFRQLLQNHRIRECINKNKSLIYDIILSQGDESCLLLFTSTVQDHQFALSYFIEKGNYDQCLQILREQKKNVDLIYHYGPLLMRQVPNQLVGILKNRCLSLDPSKLLPTLIQNSDQNGFKSEQCKEIISYLEHCVKMGITETIIHNYLIALYAELDPDKLLSYLEERSDSNRIDYDLKYALRICSEKELKKASVILFTTMGDYERAVDMSLQVDMELAKKTADIPQMDDELRRKLWLKIARHVVEEKRDIQQVSHLLADCNLLKIEDILPFFPDFVTISHFKDAICSSLKGYCQNIEALKDEMKETTESAEQIKEEISKLKNRYIIVRTDDKCSICGHSILSQPFHAFPCHHYFHQVCLISEIRSYLSPSLKERLTKVAKGEKLTRTSAIKSSVTTEKEITTIKKNNEDLNDIMTAQCLYCGDLMIESINEPLVSPEEKNLALIGW